MVVDPWLALYPSPNAPVDGGRGRSGISPRIESLITLGIDCQQFMTRFYDTPGKSSTLTVLICHVLHCQTI